ncbi:Transposase and inactivated derivatives, IS1 family [Chryseobacterium taichungense]|uniref:Transposase and inactivated derivatives, IS1 family n=1 Tax=Chryseobacterium taichungense TaxID=295069 RepID=A0A1H8C3J5_9FLAO|nr:IS1 family transposase [Chryseobacterium taichungense]SEM89655.1 Transposase and inactivated derivatives, IS1 family [Chryseobacterium taichungense]
MIEDHSSCIKVSDAGICTNCCSKNIVKNGTTKTRKQQYFCKNCHKRFIEFYSYKAYEKNINSQIIQLTKEGLGLRSIARVLQISTTTLLKRMVFISNQISTPEIPFHQSYELDEMRFYIGNKSNQMWLAYAINKITKKIVSFHVGKRTNKTLKTIIKTLINSQAEKVYTDKLRNYQYLIPKEVHSTQRFGTNSIERMNLTIRTNLKRFNRRSICFSKSIIIVNAILRIYFWT